MKNLINYHKYELENFDGGTPQVIQFIQKEPVPNGFTGELRTVNNGTTNEEVLAVLIDRLRGLGNAIPCRENSIAITKLEEALMWLGKRTANRKARGVEGKALV